MTTHSKVHVLEISEKIFFPRNFSEISWKMTPQKVHVKKFKMSSKWRSSYLLEHHIDKKNPQRETSSIVDKLLRR